MYFQIPTTILYLGECIISYQVCKVQENTFIYQWSTTIGFPLTVGPDQLPYIAQPIHSQTNENLSVEIYGGWMVSKLVLPNWMAIY